MRDKTLKAADYLKSKIKISPEIGVILGSGLGGLADEFDEEVRVKFKDIPHFPESSVKGHKGEIVAGNLCGKKVIAMAGRIHFYEGLSMAEITFPLRVMAELGIEKLIVSNAGGGVNENYVPGDIVIIKDHINFMGDNPLKGAPDFIDLTTAYSPALRSLASAVAREQDLDLKSGVYVANSGPSYETPAEVKMARIIGGDIVGMSTVPEVILANRLGIEVLGLSMITNMAAGITGEKLSHEEVIETTVIAQEKFKSLVREIIRKIKV
ncbi:MAG: purine-nucleoside phosphorylase [Elusimicrobia bacterium]|nr:purine-nucleoside phosphorylase [Elusimicrobiota bacterium]